VRLRIGSWPVTEVLRALAHRRWHDYLPAAGTAATAAAVALIAADESRGGVVCLVAAQLVLVLWLGVRRWDERLQWARPEVLVAGAWALTFTLPSCIYAADPGLLDVYEDPVKALALVNLSLLFLLGGIELGRAARKPLTRSTRLDVLGTDTSLTAVFVWIVIGLIGLLLVFQGAGGPLEYIRNLDEEGRFTQGRVYFVWMALSMRFATQVLMVAYWAAGRRAPWWTVGLFALTLGLTALLGARLFVATALVEVAVLYVLVRQPVPLRLAAPLVVLVAFALIAIGGAVKRYSNYTADNPGPDKPLPTYLVQDAPGEFADAYANNYADGVRLIAVAIATVPRYDDFERGKLLMRYALQPLPRAVRPEVSRGPALTRVLFPEGPFAHAVPLQATAYIQWGIAAVAIVFILLGAFIAWLDWLVVTAAHATFTSTVCLVATIVAVPSFLRAAEAGSLALVLMEVLGLTLVAWSTRQHTWREALHRFRPSRSA
jgi:hypothetical protein